MLNINDYTYDLPPERIAQFPLEQRDQSKLLVYSGGGIRHHKFHDLPGLLPKNTVLYFNNTRVIQARMIFQKESGASIEIFLLHPIEPSPLLLEAMQSSGRCVWQCTIGNLKRWKGDAVLQREIRNGTLRAKLLNREAGEVEFRWDSDATFAEVISETGNTPLPPYLKRDAVPLDRERYQTVYSRFEGAVAAPTAGLHFTNAVFANLEKRNIRCRYLTLHVSAGTFQPVKTDNALDHTMHAEQVLITPETIRELKNEQGLVIPVGTTSMRTLESLYWYGVRLLGDQTRPFIIGQDDPYILPQDIPVREALEAVWNLPEVKRGNTITGETSIFIRPGYTFRICKGLITNFHQPASTLILLVAAFIGEDWRRIYNEALTNDYRFLSYGDSSLLLPEQDFRFQI